MSYYYTTKTQTRFAPTLTSFDFSKKNRILLFFFSFKTTMICIINKSRFHSHQNSVVIYQLISFQHNYISSFPNFVIFLPYFCNLLTICVRPIECQGRAGIPDDYIHITESILLLFISWRHNLINFWTTRLSYALQFEMRV